MQLGRPSETAQRVVERRAAHQLFDAPQIFQDPLALTIIGAEAETSLRERASREVASVYSTTMRLFMAGA